MLSMYGQNMFRALCAVVKYEQYFQSLIMYKTLLMETCICMHRCGPKVHLIAKWAHRKLMLKYFMQNHNPHEEDLNVTFTLADI